ncbi:DUF3991 and toprim domain-containing protein [Rhizobium calliandrae]|uniref:DUF3991 and toprim domain-containing protein n=1 Tax=Rhizobium calliandrae TaxID=1312182 RepID=A0ABT7KJ27_9HYPH|nr:DUF3991 and toprim domain-containing protein [Rhizobium calliandrae]MDL2408642.1 DUF3991 and toprim domain-containing protein [Rhizobium calliandrae]
MNREDIEQLRDLVGCQAVLDSAGFALDVKESTRRAVKFRRGSEIIIVIHDGRGWFDPLNDDRGDIFSLVTHLNGLGFIDAYKYITALTGLSTGMSSWQRNEARPIAQTSIAEMWASRRPPWQGSPSWSYLRRERKIPASILRVAVAQDLLREGPYGSVWASHTHDADNVTGWEARGPAWQGFATGGHKTLYRLGSMDAVRLCVTEAAIDAMSLAAIEGMREGTLYLSTGGGWSPATETALRALVTRRDAVLVAATDANSQGDLYAARLRVIAEAADCTWLRLRPSAEDWNEVLKQRVREGEEGREER